ncbi:MAG: tyrosine-type recombinase/integrase [Caulobacteraceae bacterium]
MALSDTAIRALKPRERPFKLSDSGGLFLAVTPTGGKLWRWKYRHAGKQKLLAIGRYPDVSLKEARAKRDAARKLLATGKDPSVEKKKAALAAKLGAINTFKAVAEEFITKREGEGLATVSLDKCRWLLRLLEPGLGRRPIAEIEPYELLHVLKKVEASGRRETAKRLRAFASQVFRYAVATTRAKHDVAADLKGALVAPTTKHHAAIIDPNGVGALMRAIGGFEGQPVTQWALRLAPHVFVRPGELRQAEWPEIDLEAAIWRIPGRRMKMKREHAVPLSTQSVTILTEAKAVTGEGHYVFPGIGTAGRPMCENTLNSALRRLGYSGDEMTSHGFRSTASTLLNESGKWSVDAIERALAHGDTDNVRAAYHRGAHWAERVRMAQWWSDYLDMLRDGAEIIPFRHGG